MAALNLPKNNLAATRLIQIYQNIWQVTFYLRLFHNFHRFTLFAEWRKCADTKTFNLGLLW